MKMSKSDQHIDDQERYLVVPRTLVFLFDDQDRVLLLKGSENKSRWAGLFNGIGGHVEKGEDITDAAYRELQEEAGISDVDLYFCCQITIDVSEKVGVMIFAFKAGYLNHKFTESSEGKLFWVHLDEIKSKPIVEDLPMLIPLIAAHKPTSPVIVGMYHFNKNGDLETLFR